MISVEPLSNGDVNVVVTGDFTSADAKSLRDYSSVHLVLEDSLGWSGIGLENAAGIAGNVARLVVSSDSEIDVCRLEGVLRLQSLALSGKLKGRLDLGGSPGLYGLALYGHCARLDVLGVPASLRSFAGSVTQKIYEDIVGSASLEAIALVNADVKHLGSADNLSRVRLVRLIKLKKMNNADSILHEDTEFFKASSSSGLSISVEGCRLRKLRYFGMDNCGSVKSLDFLNSSQELAALSLRGSTKVIDGRIRAHIGHASLRSVVITDRESYDVTNVDLPKDPSCELELVQELERRSAVFPLER